MSWALIAALLRALDDKMLHAVLLCRARKAGRDIARPFADVGPRARIKNPPGKMRMRALAMSSADLTSSISHPTCPIPTHAHVSEQASEQRLARIEGRIEYPGSVPRLDNHLVQPASPGRGA